LRSDGAGRVVKRFLVIFAAVMSLSGPVVGETLTPRAFTDAVAAAAQAKMPHAKVSVVADLRLLTRSAGGEVTRTDLREAYDLYLSDPHDMDHVVAPQVATLVEMVQFGNNKAPPDRSRIVPLLRSSPWLEEARHAKAEDGISPAPELLTEPFNDELVIVCAEERPNSFRLLTMRDDVGDRSQLRELALAHLRRLITKVAAAPVRSAMAEAGVGPARGRGGGCGGLRAVY
jgi:hypothetical protein